MNSIQFIDKYRKVLSDGPDYFNPDTSMMPREKYDTAKCRILLCFGTPHVTKTVSSTAAAINDYVIEHCPDTFIDFAYLPEGSDMKIYDKENMPYAIGHITHLDASHFDIVGFSISVLHEIVSFPVMLSTFDRCDKPIPLTWSERKDLPLGEQPIIYAGGITAVCSESMFGKLPDGRQAYVDFLYLGDCGQTDILTNRYIQARATGKVNRSQEDHDVPGNPHEDIPNFESEVPVTTIQDYIDSLFDLQEIYQPQAYDVEYNDHNQIIKNVKINPKAQDFVTPFYPHKMLPDLGIGRQIINADGDNTGTAQVQVSEGCSAGGACSFAVVKGTRLWTSNGLVKIEDYDGNKMRLDNDGLEYVSVQKVQSEKPWLFVTAQGHELKASPSHKFFVVKDGELVQVLGSELQEGDVILRKIGRSVDPVSFVEPDFAELLGFMHGDGCFDKKNSRWKIYMSDLELPHYEPLFRKFVTTNYKTRIHYTGSKGNIWVIEGNAPSFEYDIADVVRSELYVPECIMQGSDEVVRRYLKGIFQADGWYNRVLGLTSISKKYIQDVALLLSTQGIDSTVNSNEYFDRNSLEGHKVSHYLQVPKEFHERFEQLIGSVSKHITDFTLSNRAKGWLKSDICFREEIRGDREYLRSNGMSDFLSSPRNYIADYKWRRLGVKQSMKEAQRLVASGQYVTDIVVAISECDEVEDMYDVVVTSNHHCVYGDWLTHNCSEGNYTGGWVEQDPDVILKLSKEAKKYSAAYKFKPYSFNCNYLRDYKGMLAKWIGMYPKVTFINMRMEELGRDVDALHMMKLVGSNRISAPMEGLSPRIQNNLLNKCLSEEALNNFMDDMVHAKLTDIKVGAIFTCIPGYQSVATDKGLVPIKDIKPGMCAMVHGTPHEITRAEYTGDKEVYEIRFKNGHIVRTSGSHKFKTQRGFVEASDLLSTDFVMQSCGSFGSQHCNDAYLVGAILGEGWLSAYDNRICLNVSPHEVGGPFEEAMTHAFGDQWHDYVNTSNKGVHDMYICSKEARNRFEGYGLTACDAHSKTIPVSVYTWDRESQSELLRGLFDTDGSVHSGKYTDVIFTSRSYQLADGVYKLLVNFGITPDFKCSGTRAYVYVRGKHNLAIFESEIGFKLAHKSEKLHCVRSDKDLRYVPGVKDVLRPWVKDNIKGRSQGELCCVRKKFGKGEDSKYELHHQDLSKIADAITPEVAEVMKYTWLQVDTVVPTGNSVAMYDISVSDVNEFVIDGCVVHNCYETDEDFQWICDFVDRFKQRAAKEGGNFPFRLKATPLVHYPLTPIEYLERKSAKASYNGEHWLTDEWYEKFREHEVFFKVNGFRYSTFIEQTFVDLGRSLTPLVYKHFVQPKAQVFSLRSCATDEYLSDLRKLVDADVYFEDRDPEHYISPCHRIHIDLMGSYIPRARRLLRHKHAGDIFANEPDIRCLKTFEGCKVKCYHNCILKDPLMLYNDVTMDEQGNLHGEPYPLNGCTRCRTNEERKNRLARDIVQTKNSDDIIATPRLPQVQKIRFVIKRLKDYDVLSPLNTSHTFITKFLQASDELLQAYHSIVNSSMDWQTCQGFRNYQYGTQIVDTIWSKNVYNIVKEYIPEINKQLKSCQVLSAEIVMRDEKIDIDDYNIYTFESTMDRGLFVDAARLYKGEVKVESAQAQGFALSDDVDSRLTPPVFAQKGGKIVGAIAVPLKYNPISYFRGFFGCIKKTSEQAVIDTTTFNCALTVRETKAASRDGKEKATISIATGKPLPFGKKGLCNALLMQLTK